MVFLAAALYYEAKPFIDRLNLKRDNSINKFQVFKNEDIVLIVTGTGSINAACACTYLIGRFDADKYDTFINLGVCGSVKKNINIGTAVLMNKIIDSGNDREFYPDILFSHPFLEGCLESFNQCVKINDSIRGQFVDMEGAAFFQAVSIFIPPHRISCIKVVSDYLSDKLITKYDIEKLMTINSDIICRWIIEIKDGISQPNDILSEKDMDYISEIIDNLKLSVTMQHELKKIAENYKLVNENLILALEPFSQIYCRSKREGKIYFAQLKRQLETF
ncbi:MAG: hypothetical protein LKE46_02790 [Clostridium sp.]|jgi:hypothetical protein|uniref:5'-methylthioadenosine/S-adenosylhomocysteine nucleosidase family protein n=1 Tax=Clostridium sp. TaxID=1506 RepID=UPI0025B82695|nr:hypothetical protein [Clostridium sp.]MCH3963175.1 hypothetical protein [Clostridium sp.]MCI1716362.1 hypothetical protein [Clostridium sp.]MCI1800702.1 hypothetical protein [Clostridium sp.]MCI1814643.1 hypothetical protein [Clostridium sp.]MCI1871553.1 hypothetical protein [Clostridium sp.]